MTEKRIELSRKIQMIIHKILDYEGSTFDKQHHIRLSPSLASFSYTYCCWNQLLRFYSPCLPYFTIKGDRGEGNQPLFE